LQYALHMAHTQTPELWVTLQRHRLDRGLTRTDLARLAGLSVPYVSQLESGTRNGRPGAIKALADALGVTVADLDDRT
jgi:transcriptional regulator with XRE-family HTH domain